MTPYERERLRMDGRQYGNSCAVIVGIIGMILWLAWRAIT
jgi:hypothetical protein